MRYLDLVVSLEYSLEHEGRDDGVNYAEITHCKYTFLSDNRLDTQNSVGFLLV